MTTSTPTAAASPETAADRPTRPSVRRRLVSFSAITIMGLVPITAVAAVTASPASAKSAKCGVVSVNPTTGAQTVVCSRNRP
jgi:hypothetical protein